MFQQQTHAWKNVYSYSPKKKIKKIKKSICIYLEILKQRETQTIQLNL